MREPPLSVKVAGLLRYTAETWKVQKLVDEAEALEAEVGRLREVPLHELAEKESEHWHELKAYRAAVAEVRRVASGCLKRWGENPNWSHILNATDKLPRDEP